MTSPLEQKLKVKGPVVITANRLRDGAVVYRAAAGGWTTDLAAAAVVTTTPAAQDLLEGAVAEDVAAVGPYVAPVELTDDRRVLPGNLRERIRLAGPTIALPSSPSRSHCIGDYPLVPAKAGTQASGQGVLDSRLRGNEREGR